MRVEQCGQDVLVSTCMCIHDIVQTLRVHNPCTCTYIVLSLTAGTIIVWKYICSQNISCMRKQPAFVHVCDKDMFFLESLISYGMQDDHFNNQP